MTVRDPVPRSLTQMLREADDELVRDLLLARPDLASPAPETFSQVASRATTRESVRRALDALSAYDLWVAARASAVDGPVTAADIDGTERADAAAALERLRRLGLLWGSAEALRAVRALGREVSGRVPDAAPAPHPPAFVAVQRQDPERVDRVATGSAFELVRRIEVLLEHVDHAPLRLRQDGGLAQRETRALASLLDLPAGAAALHAEIAQAAGLIGVAKSGRSESLLPTVDSEDWHRLDLLDQWVELARGWTQAHPPSGSAAFKQLCFAAFGPPSEGRVIGLDNLRQWLAWHRPRRAAEYARLAAALLDQAGWLGVTGLGALASFGMRGDLSALEKGLPTRTEEIFLQNDLTAVAAGPLTPSVARELAGLADVESRGGATVYRFTVESLRRAYASGWTTAQIRETLQERSRTPVPQPLDYLIGDLDRTHSGPARLATAPGGNVARRRVPLRTEVTLLRGARAKTPLDEDAAGSLVAALRRRAGDGDDDEESVTAPSSSAKPAEGMADTPLETLREAVETGELVWIGYVDASGATAERLAHAASVEEGLLHARVNGSEEQIAVPLHRITAAHIIRGSRL